MARWLAELRELTRMRVLLFGREPEAMFWVFAFPIVLAAVLGFAFRSAGPQPSSVAVVRGEGTEELLEAIELDELLEAVVFETRESAFDKLRRAAVDGMIEPGDPPRLTFDPGRVEAETIRLRVLRILALSQEGGSDPPLELSPVTETGSRYIDFLFPGLLGMNLMGTGMWGIGFGIADARRRKFLKRLLVTPMRRSSYLLSFILFRLVFLVAEVVILVGIGTWALEVPFRCDVFTFALVTLLGAATFAGIGILVASRARTIEGVSGLMNFVMMPMWLASGVFFSYERFPEAFHPLLKLLPLTSLNDALRAVMLEGESLLQQAPELGTMAVWCVLTFAVALKIFRWE